jgi:CheY-like chemotaxis protein
MLPRSLAGLRVLVIEDDPDAREILNRTIADAGGSIISTASSAEALASLSAAAELPQVIVTDIGMPKDDGYSFLRALRRLPASHGGSVPAIALTAFASAADRRRALAAGFASHLVKPVAPGLLVSTVASLARR